MGKGSFIFRGGSPFSLSTLSTPLQSFQHTWQNKIFSKYRKLGAKVDIRQRKLLEEGVREEEVEVRARLQSLTLPHAGDWLHAAPSWP